MSNNDLSNQLPDFMSLMKGVRQRRQEPFRARSGPAEIPYDFYSRYSSLV